MLDEIVGKTDQGDKVKPDVTSIKQVNLNSDPALIEEVMQTLNRIRMTPEGGFGICNLIEADGAAFEAFKKKYNLTGVSNGVIRLFIDRMEKNLLPTYEISNIYSNGNL